MKGMMPLLTGVDDSALRGGKPATPEDQAERLNSVCSIAALSHTLPEGLIEQSTARPATGAKATEPALHCVGIGFAVYTAGQKRGMTATIKREMRCRAPSSLLSAVSRTTTA